jgi:hypothetical protein
VRGCRSPASPLIHVLEGGGAAAGVIVRIEPKVGITVGGRILPKPMTSSGCPYKAQAGRAWDGEGAVRPPPPPGLPFLPLCAAVGLSPRVQTLKSSGIVPKLDRTSRRPLLLPSPLLLPFPHREE